MIYDNKFRYHLKAYSEVSDETLKRKHAQRNCEIQQLRFIFQSYFFEKML